MNDCVQFDQFQKSQDKFGLVLINTYTLFMSLRRRCKIYFCIEKPFFTNHFIVCYNIKYVPWLRFEWVPFSTELVFNEPIINKNNSDSYAACYDW